MIHIFCSSLYENPNRRHCISLNPRIVQDLDYCCLLRRSSLSPNNSLAEVFSLLTIEEFILDQNLAAAFNSLIIRVFHHFTELSRKNMISLMFCHKSWKYGSNMMFMLLNSINVIFCKWQLLSIKENICAERPWKSYALQDAKK